jgi:protein TonB
MFEQTSQVGTGRTRRPWTVPVSFCGQIAAVGFLVLLPLIFTERLPMGRLAPPAPIRLGAWRPSSGTVMKIVGTAVVEKHPGALVEPPSLPRGTARLIEAPEISVAAEQGPPCAGPCRPNGEPNGLPWGVPLVGEPSANAPPVVRTAERPRPATKPPARIVQQSKVQEAQLISRIIPVYPRLAVTSHISGTVLLAAVIGTDGRVRELQVRSGHPLLAPAAMDAVRQWIYRPTTLNGEPVEVATEITVQFILGGL